MKTIITVILIISFQINILGQDDILFIWDKEASAISSAKNLLSIHKVLYEFQNKNIKSKYWKEDNWKKKSLGIGYRFVKTILIDYQIDYLIHLHQHEIFGHGYRYREYEYERNSYNIKLPPPYGSGGGFARRGSTTYARKLGEHEEIMIRSGGMEASAVLSNNLRNRWLVNGKINYRESLLYLSTLHDYSGYILSTKLFNNDTPGNDVDNYLRTVNASYGYNTEESYKLTLNEISKRTSVNLINTFHFLAIYSYLKVYLINGEEEFKYPMIKLGNMNWLPSIRFGLTPFGSEFIVENFIKKGKNISTVNIRIGDNKLDKFWGGGISHYWNISNNIQIGSYGDFWVQPSMDLGGETRFKTKEGFGGRIIGEINFHLKKNFPIGIYSQIGYKSTGYIEGERLNNGLILRLGISIKKEHGTEQSAKRQ